MTSYMHPVWLTVRSMRLSLCVMHFATCALLLCDFRVAFAEQASPAADNEETGGGAAAESELRCDAARQSARLDSLIGENRWEDARRLVLPGGECDWSVATRSAVATVKRETDELVRLLNKDNEKVAQVTPAFQWAQNSTHVFLQIKYAARWNAPGALELSGAPEVDFTECCFRLVAFGEHSGIRKRYGLDLIFSNAIEPTSGVWSAASVGKMSVTLGKATRGKWSALLTKGSKLKNFGLWVDLQERWNAELSGKNSSTDNKTNKTAAAQKSAETSKSSDGESASKGSKSGGKASKAKKEQSMLNRALKAFGVSKSSRKKADANARKAAPWACVIMSFMIAFWLTLRRRSSRGEDKRAACLAAAQQRQESTDASNGSAPNDSDAVATDGDEDVDACTS